MTGQRQSRQEGPGAKYSAPRVVELGRLWERTLKKKGSLTDGIHIQRQGGGSTLQSSV
jgi:hypothetical protein